MRFKIKYDGTDYSEALINNKKRFIQDNELENDELAKILVYAIPTTLNDSDLAAFMLLLDTYKRYNEIRQLLNKQGLIVYSSTGTMIVNKLLSAEKNYTQLLHQQLRSFGCTIDSRVGAESEKLQQQAEEQDPVLQLIGELKELKE